jgi:uncharacterized protein DUF5667
MEPRFPQPKLRDEFRRELRTRLMTEAVTALTTRSRPTAWAFWRPALTVGLASVMLASVSGAAAAAGSLPGDPAFGLKRAVEDLQVTLTFDDVQRVQLLAQLADRRVQELQQVTESQSEDRAPAAAEEVAQAVARFRAAVDAVQQAAPAEKSDAVQGLVDAAREKHEAVLDRVQQNVGNEKAREAIERAQDEEDRDTHDEKGKKKDPSSTPRPTRTPSPRSGDNGRPNQTPRR